MNDLSLAPHRSRRTTRPVPDATGGAVPVGSAEPAAAGAARSIRSAADASVPGVTYHRAAHAVPRRRYWTRPLIALLVSTMVFVGMILQAMVPLLVAGLIWPSFAPSASLADPLNPIDQLLGLGSLALLVPAVLIGTLAGYGRAGLALSVTGRVRWGLLGRAALVVVPVYVLVNGALNLLLERDSVVMPPLGAGVLLAWLIALVLAPLQSAGEELAFRALPMQVLGTWLRRPVVGILVPVPLFILGHGYNWVGQVDIALFAIVMGMLAWKTGGLEIPILLHAANNGTLFAIAPLIPGFLEQGEVGALGLVLALAPMLLLAAGIWWWYSRREGLGLWEPQRGAGQTVSSTRLAASTGARPSSAASTSRPLSV